MHARPSRYRLDRRRRAEAWRERARQLRTVATGFADEAARRDLEDLARAWERQADWMLRLSDPQPPKQRTG